jgi:hypothetical protein
MPSRGAQAYGGDHFALKMLAEVCLRDGREHGDLMLGILAVARADRAGLEYDERGVKG